MFDADRWQEIYITVRANKLRTLLTMASVFWGTFMLLVMLAAGQGLETGIKTSLINLTNNSCFIWSQRTTIPYQGMQPGRRISYDNRDTEAIRRQIDGVQYFAPRNQLGDFRGSSTVSRGDKVAAFSIMGDYPQFLHITNMTVKSGRFVNDIDIADRRKVAVIGTGVTDLLFDRGESPLGEYIKVSGVYFQVVGEMKTTQTGDRGERDSQTVYIPFTTFQTAFNFGDRVGWFALTARPEVDIRKVEKEVRALLANRHKIHPEDEPAIGSFNSAEVYDDVNRVFVGIKVLVWFVGILTLLAAIIGVGNIMIIVVKERTNEIGVRKALGAPPRSIVTTFVQESIAFTTFAGYLGVATSVGLVELFNSLNLKLDAFANPVVDLTTALIAMSILVVAGAIAGLLPAWRAAHAYPVEALRAE